MCKYSKNLILNETDAVIGPPTVVCNILQALATQLLRLILMAPLPVPQDAWALIKTIMYALERSKVWMFKYVNFQPSCF